MLMETKKEILIGKLIKYDRSMLFGEKFLDGIFVMQEIANKFETYPKSMYEGKEWYISTEKEYGQDTVIVEAYPITQNEETDEKTNEESKMTEETQPETTTKEITVNYVARTGGIKAVGDDTTWYNPTEDIKQQVMDADIKGKKITLTMSDGKFSAFTVAEGQDVTTSTPAPKPNTAKTISIQGRDFVTFAGLLEVAHANGLRGVESESVIIEKDLCVFKATATMINGKRFTAHGDATPQNVGANIVPHVIRMAETRAIARALRLATNIGTTAVEELGEDSE